MSRVSLHLVSAFVLLMVTAIGDFRTGLAV